MGLGGSLPGAILNLDRNYPRFRRNRLPQNHMQPDFVDGPNRVRSPDDGRNVDENPGVPAIAFNIARRPGSTGRPIVRVS